MGEYLGWLSAPEKIVFEWGVLGYLYFLLVECVFPIVVICSSTHRFQETSGGSPTRSSPEMSLGKQRITQGGKGESIRAYLFPFDPRLDCKPSRMDVLTLSEGIDDLGCT